MITIRPVATFVNENRISTSEQTIVPSSAGPCGLDERCRARDIDGPGAQLSVMIARKSAPAAQQ
jgi:hypothetical protein